MRKFKKASDIKVGVIGYGGAFNMGLAHLNQMKQAGMTPCAVAEVDAGRRKAAEVDFPGMGVYASTAEMLRKSDVDLVSIITPHNTHAAIALQCLRAGRNVVCEKPFAIKTAECDVMIREAKKRKLVLSTYHNRHWDGCIMEAVARIKAGAIGELVRVEAHMTGYGKPGDWWRTSKSISGGILYDWGVHLLEYSLQLIDSDMVEVSGFRKTGFWGPQTAWKADTNEDEGYAVVRFRNGVWLSLMISTIDSKPRDGIVEFTGTKGTYVMGHGDYQVITLNQEGQTVVVKGANRPSENWKFYKNIADHMTRGAKLVITPEWARRPIHILDMADRSARLGRAMKATCK